LTADRSNAVGRSFFALI